MKLAQLPTMRFQRPPLSRLVTIPEMVFSLLIFVASAATIIGRNNTVLYLTDSSNGLANGHMASAFALMVSHPDIEIHWGSFAKPSIEMRLWRTSLAAWAKEPTAKPIVFHEFNAVGMVESLHRLRPDIEDWVMTPGLADNARMLDFMVDILLPDDVDEYYTTYQEAVALIKEVDPAVVVVDGAVSAFRDVMRASHRPYAIMMPNALTDLIPFEQPRGAALWKYPVIGSGLPYPIPWRQILTNAMLRIRLIWTIVTSRRMSAGRRSLRERGIEDPLNMQMIYPDVPLISGDFPEAGLPLAYHPPNVVVCGPMVLDIAPAEEQDPEMANWLARGPTMLVLLGANMRYTERRARVLGVALCSLIDSTDAQVLWKFVKEGQYDDSWRQPLEDYIANGRLRMETYIHADPVSLLRTGHIAVWVHHGGANCYFEAVSSGVRQVVLPLWFDLYNFAQTAEYVGVGIWPGKGSAPEWEAETLAEGLLTVWQGEKAEAMQRRADELEVAFGSYAGRECAASHIARMARFRSSTP